MIDNQVFLYDNLVKLAEITASSENSQYPASNLKDDRRSKSYRSATNSAEIVFDFGVARDINIFSVVTSSLNSFGFTDLVLEFNTSNIWDDPLYSEPVPFSILYGFGYVSLPETINVRYARLVLSNTSSYCELSKVFFGVYAELGKLAFEYPLVYRQNNNAVITKNRLGQRFIDEINSQKEVSGSISVMTKEELTPLLEMLDYCSSTIPLWVIFPEGNITEDNQRLNGYYYFKDDPSLRFEVGNFWSTTLNLEEAT